ncbi:MAG: cation:proton antiporter [Deltaproteobacteria bacterium]
MTTILILGIILSAGWVLGEAFKMLRLPKVTGYIVAGVLLNPRLFPLIPPAFVAGTDTITNISLSLITFSVGGTLLLRKLRASGIQILGITFFEAEGAFLAVTLGFALALPFLWAGGRPALILPLGLLLGCLASPTDPTANLAIMHEYGAKGRVASTIMGVAALDDALGIMNYSFAIVLSRFLIVHGVFSWSSSVLAPLGALLLSAVLGVLFGLLLNVLTPLVRRETEGAMIVLLLAVLWLCYGTARYFRIDELLTTMVMGATVVNTNPRRHTIFRILERYTDELVFVLFFTISGMHLDFLVLGRYGGFVLLFVALRTLGKFAGTAIAARLTRAPESVRRYTAGGLIPQGGIVIGLALVMRQEAGFSDIAPIIINIILGATIIHELIGPVVVQRVLRRAGEIGPPARRSAYGQ